MKRLEGRVPALTGVFHIPNGGLRHPAVAKALARQGVKPGVWDVFALSPFARLPFALAIEFKRSGLTVCSIEDSAHTIIRDERLTLEQSLFCEQNFRLFRWLITSDAMDAARYTLELFGHMLSDFIEE